MLNDPTRVLLLEDDPGDERLLRAMLAQTPGGQFVLTRTQRLAETLDRLVELRFDVILSDLAVPDSQGLDTLSRLRERVPDLPIVVLSGEADETLAIEAVRNGAQDYLLKGQVNTMVLTRSLRYAIERKRLELERERLIGE